MSPKEYFEKYYKKDLDLYVNSIGNCLCERVVYLYFNQEDKKLIDDNCFFICQYELNLLNQVFYNYFKEHHVAWSNKIAPFVSCRCTYSRYPWDIFDWVLRSSKILKKKASFTKKEILEWDLFFKNYIGEILKNNEFNALSVEKVFEAIKDDQDCQSASKYLMSIFN